MKQFDEYLHEYDEVGVVSQVRQAVVYIEGLPRVRLSEVVMLESGELGQVIALQEEYVEVLVLSVSRLKIGLKAVRTGELLAVPVSDGVLGSIISPLGQPIMGSEFGSGAFERRVIDTAPFGIERRENVWDPLETGVAMVDLLVPLGKGQRELVIGDRKIGKTQFLKQALVANARRGGVNVYAGIARRLSDVYDLKKYLKDQGVDSRTAQILSLASDPSGLIFITPYAAMTVAEYFRDKGFDVLIVLDDMTIHAKYYRELSLLSQRFPGRSAYPGDVFYAQARLMERAGKFDKGSISCLPVAETVLSDIRGYIQTNLMSMTDGHIYFDHELYNRGRRPAVNPFLSVTRVGHQTRSVLLKSLSQQVTSFLVHHEKLTKLTHFGEELSGDARKILALGERIIAFFDQPGEVIVPMTVATVFLTSIWSGMWDAVDIPIMKANLSRVVNAYYSDPRLKETLDSLLSSAQTLPQLTEALKTYQPLLMGTQSEPRS